MAIKMNNSLTDYKAIDTLSDRQVTYNDELFELSKQKYSVDLLVQEDRIKQLDSVYNVASQVKSEVTSFEGVNFGVLGHIDQKFNFYRDAWDGIVNLRDDFISDNDKEDDAVSEEDALIKRIYAYFNEVENSNLYSIGQARGFLGSQLTFDYFKRGQLDIEPLEPTDDGTDEKDTGWFYYKSLFDSGKAIRKDIRKSDRLYRALNNLHNFQVKQLAKAKTELAKIDASLPQAQRELASLNRQRKESLAEYQVARLLIAENWADVANAYIERAKILNSHKGLYYARVRETPLNNHPVSHLPLRAGTIDDLVPGYPLTDGELPSELEPFMDAVLDIPMADWVSLAGQTHLLPKRPYLHKLMGLRQARIEYYASRSITVTGTPLAYQLYNMRGFAANRARSQQRSLPGHIPSLVAYQQASARVLSLDDLLTGAPHRVNGLVQRQRNKIDQATQSLLHVLRSVAPSIRLEWSVAAEEDTLDVTEPSRWPGLGKAEQTDLNSIRTLIELVQWWWRQLTDSAEPDSVSAVRNLLRAILVFSAADDPDQILQGELTTIPAEFKPGAALRITLNRETLPGTQLQLIGQNSELVGTLRVDDFDDTGAVTTLTTLHTANLTPNTNFTVIGYALPGQRR